MTISRCKTPLEKAIEAHQTDYLKHKNVVDGYLVSAKDNLIEPFPNCWEQIEREFNEGDGNELKPKEGKKPKFCAVYSSSALCVNNFVPFKEHHAELSFLNYSGFDEARFEKKLSTGISFPNLDFYLENKTTVIGIESKFTEGAFSKKWRNCSCFRGGFLR